MCVGTVRQPKSLELQIFPCPIAASHGRLNRVVTRPCGRMFAARSLGSSYDTLDAYQSVVRRVMWPTDDGLTGVVEMLEQVEKAQADESERALISTIKGALVERHARLYRRREPPPRLRPLRWLLFRRLSQRNQRRHIGGPTAIGNARRIS
jgi:hypothetical protein